MPIYLASEMGFCFGVRRAINLAELALREHGSLVSLGKIVHNRQVVDMLISRGMHIVESIDEIKEETLLIPSHGVGRSTIDKIQARGLHVIDATCPIVQRAQNVVSNLHANGFTVLVFGDASHTEVKGLLSWAGEGAIATFGVPDFDTPHRHIGVISQTTQSQVKFADFLAELMRSELSSVAEIHIFNTICDATAKRQQATLKLAAMVDLMIVIGGHDSANTRHLAEICSTTGVRTLQIETADEIDPSFDYRTIRIGITAGASTPEWIINAVTQRLSAFSA